MTFWHKNFQMPQWRQGKLSAQTVNGNKMCSTALTSLGRMKKRNGLDRKWLSGKLAKLLRGYSGHTNFLKLYISADILAADMKYTQKGKRIPILSKQKESSILDVLMIWSRRLGLNKSPRLPTWHTFMCHFILDRFIYNNFSHCFINNFFPFHKTKII